MPRRTSNLLEEEAIQKITGRTVRWAFLTMGLTGLLVAVNASPGAARPASGLTNVTLARGTDLSNGTIPLQEGTDIVMTRITVLPGGSSGWHSHPGDAMIVVKQGDLTVYRSAGSVCDPTRYTAGQAFIERPGEVDDVINTGTTPLRPLRDLPSCASGRGRED